MSPTGGFCLSVRQGHSSEGLPGPCKAHRTAWWGLPEKKLPAEEKDMRASRFQNYRAVPPVRMGFRRKFSLVWWGSARREW